MIRLITTLFQIILLVVCFNLGKLLVKDFKEFLNETS